MWKLECLNALGRSWRKFSKDGSWRVNEIQLVLTPILVKKVIGYDFHLSSFEMIKIFVQELKWSSGWRFLYQNVQHPWNSERFFRNLSKHNKLSENTWRFFEIFGENLFIPFSWHQRSFYLIRSPSKNHYFREFWEKCLENWWKIICIISNGAQK